MRRSYLNTTMIVLTCLFSVRAIAYDIAVANSDGVTIYYNWINGGTDLEVTYQGDTPYNYGAAYTGNVVIPSSANYNGTDYPVTSIGEAAFFMSLGLTSVSIPNSVKTIGNDAFQLCYSLSSATLGNAIKSIGDCAFQSCNILGDVILGNSLESIGVAAFEDCYAITTIEIPNTMTMIEQRTFNGCTSLSNLTLGNSITTIGKNAFGSCPIKSLSIPATITSIGSGAFSGLRAEELVIPASVANIGDNAFTGRYLKTIKVADGNTVYDSRDNCNALIETNTNKLLIGSNTTVIPNTVKEIASFAFTACKEMTNIYIPKSVVSNRRRCLLGVYRTEIYSSR